MSSQEEAIDIQLTNLTERFDVDPKSNPHDADDESSDFSEDDDPSSDFDETESNLTTQTSGQPLSASEQLSFFVRAFMKGCPDYIPEDVVSIVEKKVDPQFKWKLGLLEWRPYSKLTEKSVASYYGRNSHELKSINYAISVCVATKQVKRIQTSLSYMHLIKRAVHPQAAL